MRQTVCVNAWRCTLGRQEDVVTGTEAREALRAKASWVWIVPCP